MRNCLTIWFCLLFPLGSLHSSPQVINRIIFKGNKTVPSYEIQAVMILKEGGEYDPFLLEQDMGNILEFYQAKGFPDAEIAEKRLVPKKKDRVNVELLVTEGPRIRIESIEVTGHQALSTSEILDAIGLRVGSPFDPDVISLGEYKIKSLYDGKGYAYAMVRSNILREDRSAGVTYHIQERQEVSVGQVIIEGNQYTHRRIIEREITIRPGDVYNPERVYSSQEKLYATNLFRDVDFEVQGLKDSSSIVDVIFRVEELFPLWASLGGGYQSPDRFLANIGLGHDNLFNNAQKLTVMSFLSYNLKKEHEERIELEYLDPYLLNTAFRLMLRAFHNRERWISYSQRETGTNVRIGTYITQNLGVFTQYQYKSVYIDTLEGAAEGITNSILLSLSRDTRDSPFNTFRGTFNTVTLEIAGGMLGGTNHFRRTILDYRAFFNPLERVVAGIRLKYGELSPFGLSKTEGVSLNERFELGGGASVRGYREASIGPMDGRKRHSGCVMLNSNLESRVRMYKMLWMGLFIDSGGVWMDRNEIRLSDLKFSYGIGLRYSLPVGAVRVDFARKLTDRTPGEFGSFYVAIGHLF